MKKIKLSKLDKKTFFDNLEKPPKPNKKLKRAAMKYKIKIFFVKIKTKLKEFWKFMLDVQQTIDRARERSGWGKI